MTKNINRSNTDRFEWDGNAYLVNTFNSNIIYILSFLVIFMIIYLMFFCSFAKRIEIEGEVVSTPKSLNIKTNSYGFIKNVFVHNGALVNKGDKLVSIDSSFITKEGRDVNLKLNNVSNQIEIIKKSIANREELSTKRIYAFNQQISQYKLLLSKTTKIEIDIQNGLSSFENNKKSFEDFLKKGLITKEQAVIQSYNYYQQYGLYQSIFMQRNDIVSKMAELEEKEEEEKNDSEIFIKSNLLKIIDLQNYLNDLEIKNEQIVVSPINGIIESLNTSQGEQVNTGDVLIQVSPSIKKHNIITWVPNYVIPYIKVNDQVIIRYDAFPYEQYGQFVGKIESISNLSATDDEISKYNLKPYKNIDSLSFYKVLIAGTESMIELKDTKFYIRDNLIAKITLFYDRRTLYDWIFTPIYKTQSATKENKND